MRSCIVSTAARNNPMPTNIERIPVMVKSRTYFIVSQYPHNLYPYLNVATVMNQKQ